MAENISEAEQKLSFFNWDNFWKQFALIISIAAAVLGIIFVIIGYVVHTTEKIGILEGQVQILMQEKQNKTTPEPSVAP